MEDRAFSWGRCGSDCAAVRLDDAPRDCEAKPGARTHLVAVAGAGGLASIKAIKHMGQIAAWDAFATISDGQLDFVGGSAQGEGYRAVGGSVPYGILDQIVQYALHPGSVQRHTRQRTLHLALQMDVFLASLRLHTFQRIRYEVFQ